MDEIIYVMLKVLFDFALEVWFSIFDRRVNITANISFEKEGCQNPNDDLSSFMQ